MFAFPLLFLGWKLVHKTKFHKPQDIDLGRDLDVIDEYERNFVPVKSKYVSAPFLAIVAKLINQEHLHSGFGQGLWIDRGSIDTSMYFKCRMLLVSLLGDFFQRHLDFGLAADLIVGLGRTNAYAPLMF